MCDCIFCQNVSDGILFETNNFYIRVGKAIITPGHIMITPKNHYLAMGEIDNDIKQEYLDLKERVVEEVKNKFSEPFLIEYGVYGQSVFHAHIHIIPSSGDGYNNINLHDQLLSHSLKTLNLNPIFINNFEELQNYYNKYGKYIYYEDSKKRYIIPVETFSKEDIKFFGYRIFFSSIGLNGIRSWKNMTESDIANDKIKIEKTMMAIKL